MRRCRTFGTWSGRIVKVYDYINHADKRFRLVIHLQRICNFWCIHAMFIIIPYDFGMIWLELTRTDAVFSRTAVVLFLCRNKSSQNVMKINEDFFWKIWKRLERKSTGGESRGPHEGGRYVSNVSIIFYCSMLYYLLFWTLLGFIIHFYIIFGTNLITDGPA